MCMNVCVEVYMYVGSHVYTYGNTHILHIYMHTHMWMYVCISVCMYVVRHTWHICAGKYIHTLQK